MAAQRELPVGAHHETKWSDAHQRAFEKFAKVIDRFDLINLMTNGDRVFVTYGGRNTNGR